MRIRSLVVGVSAALAVAAAVAVGASAEPGDARPALPPGAVKVAEDTYFVGTRVLRGVRVEGYAFVHRAGEAKGNAKGKPPGGGGSACYAFLASGAKWKAVESWRVDEGSAPASVRGMRSLMDADVATWESANTVGDVFGGSSTDNTYEANLDAPDDVNGAEFGPLTEPNVIAVTYVWGLFGGPPRARELVEWDMVFNTAFSWSTNGAAGTMDFRNISTHELGHAMGLGHPSSTCTEETMYAYASTGETKKQTLNSGDIAGINALY